VYSGSQTRQVGRGEAGSATGNLSGNCGRDLGTFAKLQSGVCGSYIGRVIDGEKGGGDVADEMIDCGESGNLRSEEMIMTARTGMAKRMDFFFTVFHRQRHQPLDSKRRHLWLHAIKRTRQTTMIVDRAT